MSIVAGTDEEAASADGTPLVPVVISDCGLVK